MSSPEKHIKKSSIQVGFWFRGHESEENPDDPLCDDIILLADSGSCAFEGTDFTFDHLFVPDDIQEKVYLLTARQLLNEVIDGYNGTIFVYG